MQSTDANASDKKMVQWSQDLDATSMQTLELPQTFPGKVCISKPGARKRILSLAPGAIRVVFFRIPADRHGNGYLARGQPN